MIARSWDNSWFFAGQDLLNFKENFSGYNIRPTIPGL
jgi:hypothetical protein